MAGADEDDAAAANASATPGSTSYKRGLLKFVKSIASFNGDLWSMTAPPFILGTTSLTEFSSYWAEHSSVFVAPANEPDPAKRMMLVMRWFLTTLKQQYSSRSDKLGSEKKPLNPFLGELFLGKWEDPEAGEIQLVSEQVNHHPPVTAYSVTNEKNGVRLQGYNGQKASFSRTIQVRQIGHAILNLDKYNETYLFTLPSLHIEGLIYGSPFVELDKHTVIVSSSGYMAKIDYSGKGWMSGKRNSFNALLTPIGKEHEVLYSAEGQWNDSFVIKQHDAATGGSSGHFSTKKAAAAGTTIETWKASEHPTSELHVLPLDEQDPRESRRAWHQVAEAIVKGDMEAVSQHKSKIENSQRQRRKDEAAEGVEWQRTFFSRLPNNTPDPVFAQLADQAGVPGAPISIEADKTGGVWRFDPEKAKNAHRPFPGGV